VSGAEVSRSGWWTGGLALGVAPRSAEADVVVVGLGGSGLGAVHRALDFGRSVIGVDAGPVAGGAAGRNGGFLLAGLAEFHHDAVRAYGRDEARACFRLTEAARDAIIAEVPACVRRVGSLRRPMDAAEADDVRTQLEAMKADGLNARWVGTPEGVGLLVPGDAAFDPYRRCRQLAVRARRRGARLFERTSVCEVHDGRVVTDEGTIRARHVVLAIDAGAPELGFDAGIRPVRLQMLATAPTADVAIGRAIYARWGFDYWQQRPDGRVFLGGGRDRDPTPSPSAHPVSAPPGWSGNEVDSEVQAHLDGVLRGVIGTDAPVVARWAGRVGYTDDARPRLVRLSPHVAACGGYTGHGNVIGWMMARAAVELLETGRPPPAARLTGRSVDP
jgi:glycine/D-amino acid oxidase-like deaminating enzyme